MFIKKKISYVLKDNVKPAIGITLLFCFMIFVLELLSPIFSSRIINSEKIIWHYDFYYTIKIILYVIFIELLSLPLQVGYISCCCNKIFSIKQLFSFYRIKKIRTLCFMFLFAALPFSVPGGILIYNIIICWRCNLFTLLFIILTLIFNTILLISIFLYLQRPLEKYKNNLKQSYKIFIRCFFDIVKFNLAYIPWAILILHMIGFSFHLYWIGVDYNIIFASRVLIFPLMYGLGLFVLPYYIISLCGLLEKIKSGRSLSKNKTKKTKMISKQDGIKLKRKKIFIGTLIILIISCGTIFYFLFPQIKGRYLISSQKDNLNTIVSYLKSNYNDGDKYACLNYDSTFAILNQNMKESKCIAIEDNSVKASTNTIYKKIKDTDGSYSGIVSSYDNEGRQAVYICYYVRDIPFRKHPKKMYLVYIEKDYDMSLLKLEGKLKEIKDNWYIISN